MRRPAIAGERSTSLVERLAQVRAELAGLEQRADEQLLREVAVTARGLAFTAAHIIDAARGRDRLQALLAATRRATARSLGKFLRACEGRVIGGVRVRRLVKTFEGRLWVVDSVPDSQIDACPREGPRV